MRHFLTLFIVMLFLGKNTYSQNISLGNNDIVVEIKYAVGSIDTVLIVMKNMTNKTALISMVDGVNTNGKYLGIGLYSSVFPYTPDHLSKYTGELKLTAINVTDSIVIKQKIKTKLLEGLDFNLDYVLQDMKVNTNEFAMIDRAVYDKDIRFLKLKINK
jgi:hypothetical protein